MAPVLQLVLIGPREPFPALEKLIAWPKITASLLYKLPEGIKERETLFSKSLLTDSNSK